MSTIWQKINLNHLPQPMKAQIAPLPPRQRR